jgi:hypothetical protein
MALYTIPLNSQPNQSFRVTIPQGDGNLALEMGVYWNEIAQYWQMNLLNLITNEQLIYGLPLLFSNTPAENLFSQFQYWGIGSAFLIPISENLDGEPTSSQLGTDYVLVWET